MRGGDFGARTDALDLFSPSVRRRRGILTAGVRRESHAILAMERGVGPTALRGRSAEASGDALPVVAVDAGSGQMQHDAPYGGLDPGTEFHQMFAQGVDLGRAERGACGPQAQLLEEHVGGGGQKPPQLVSEEAGATGAVDLESVVQLLDPILDVGAGAVDHFIQMLWRLLEVGDHEARVVLWLTAVAVIPPRRNRLSRRRYDRSAYRDRNRIERFFCRIKQFRRVATRYDKLVERYASIVALGASFVWLNA